jgi:pimeloyl-ACP methyl ester carboxylesterase
VVIASDGTILEFRGNTAPYLEIAPGLATLDLLRMAREELRAPLRKALEQARTSGAPARREGIAIPVEKPQRRANIEVAPFRVAASAPPYFLVLFEDPPGDADPEPNEPGSSDPGCGPAGRRPLSSAPDDLLIAQHSPQALVEDASRSKPIWCYRQAHGAWSCSPTASGSSRFSTRKRFVAGELNECGLGTLLLDLLTIGEEHRDAVDAHLRFDVELLASRLCAVTAWLRMQPATEQLPIGYFGASTGAAAAFIAAAALPKEVGAIVSRGGRPDLARHALPHVQAPTLLIVGGEDWTVLDLTRQAAQLLRCEQRLEVVEGATHLFEETGALEEVAELAGSWSAHHLSPNITGARMQGSAR